MVKEVDLQSRLVEEARRTGGYALKMSNRFVVGVPDLLIQLPGLPTVLVECKAQTLPAKPETPFRLGLSRHQSASIDHINESGGNAGWCLFVPKENGAYWLPVGREPVDLIPQAALASCLFKARGEAWPVEAVVRRIVDGKAG